MAPKVSVIIPMYNAASYLADTLASVYAQTYQDFEVLLIDDGSTDNTLALARRIAPTARIFTQGNRGPSAARNVGFRNASGEFLAWLDSDDLWHPELLRTQVNYLENNSQIQMVYAESWAFTQETGCRLVVNKIGYTVQPDLKLLLYGDCIPTNTILLRRSCFEQVGEMNESLVRAEDYEYLMRIAYCSRLAGIDRPLAYYRWRKGSLVGNNRDIDRGLRDAIIAIQKVEQRHPDIWQQASVNRAQLLARLQLRAGHAWKRRGYWHKAIRQGLKAFRYSRHPLVMRWLIAALVLKRWS